MASAEGSRGGHVPRKPDASTHGKQGDAKEQHDGQGQKGRAKKTHAAERARNNLKPLSVDHGRCCGSRRGVRGGAFLKQEFAGPTRYGFEGQGKGLAQAWPVAGAAQPLTHRCCQSQVIEGGGDALDVVGVVPNAQGKGLLLQVVPHHLEVEATADLHKAQVVAGLPALHQQRPQFGATQGGFGGTRGISQGQRWERMNLSSLPPPRPTYEANR